MMPFCDTPSEKKSAMWHKDLQKTEGKTFAAMPSRFYNDFVFFYSFDASIMSHRTS